MAITLDTLARALRVSTPLDADQTAELTRILAVAIEVVNKYAPAAPEATTDESVIRVAGYLFDAGSTTEPGALGALNAIRLSGAAPLLAPYRVHRAGAIEPGGASPASISGSGVGGDDAYPWATVGNDDPVPLDKLSLAPTSTGGGLSQAQVDARVDAGVADWAEQGDTSTVPDNKIPSTIARDSEVPTNAEIDSRVRAITEDFAEVGNGQTIPHAKLPQVVTQTEAETGTEPQLRSFSPLSVRQAADSAVSANIPSGGGAPTYTVIASDSTLSANQFIFTSTQRNAFRDAWNAETYSSFLILVISSDTTADIYQEYRFSRYPGNPDLRTTGNTMWRFDDVAIRLGNLVELSYSTGGTFLMASVVGHWATGATCTLYGVS